MSGAESWVWFNWAVENESSMFGGTVEREGLGYVGQEMDKLKWLMTEKSQ